MISVFDGKKHCNFGRKQCITSNNFLGKKFRNLRSKPMVLFIFLDIVLRCSSKFSLQSKNIPRYFCNETW